MNAHVRAQALRFVRVSGLAFVAAVTAQGGHVSWASAWALGAGAVEVALRQILPVLPLPDAVLKSVRDAAEPTQAPAATPPVAPS